MTDSQWIKLTAGVLRRRDLKAGPKILYARLADLEGFRGDGTCRPSLESLALELGTFKSTVLEWVRRLIEVGLIRVAKTGRGTLSSTYGLDGPVAGKPNASGREAERIASTLSYQTISEKEEPPSPPAPSFATSSAEKNKDRAHQNMQAMRNAGLQPNDRTRKLAANPRCTPELVNRVAANGQQNGALVIQIEDATRSRKPAPPTSVPQWHDPNEERRTLADANLPRQAAESVIERFDSSEVERVALEFLGEQLPSARARYEALGRDTYKTFVARKLDPEGFQRACDGQRTGPRDRPLSRTLQGYREAKTRQEMSTQPQDRQSVLSAVRPRGGLIDITLLRWGAPFNTADGNTICIASVARSEGAPSGLVKSDESYVSIPPASCRT
jgi:hypothetical protein